MATPSQQQGGGLKRLLQQAYERFNLPAAMLSLPKEREPGYEVPGDIAGPPLPGNDRVMQPPQIEPEPPVIGPGVREAIAPPPPFDQNGNLPTPESISLRTVPGLDLSREEPSVMPGRDSGELRLGGGYYDASRGRGIGQKLKSPSFWLAAVDRIAQGAAAGENERSFLGGYARAGDELAARDEYAANAPYRRAQLEATTGRATAEASLARQRADTFPIEFEQGQRNVESQIAMRDATAKQIAAYTDQARQALSQGKETHSLALESAATNAAIQKFKLDEMIRLKRLGYSDRQAQVEIDQKLASIGASDAQAEYSRELGATQRYQREVDMPERRRIESIRANGTGSGGGERKPPSVGERGRLRRDHQAALNAVKEQYFTATGRLVIGATEDDYRTAVKEINDYYQELYNEASGDGLGEGLNRVLKRFNLKP